VGVIGKQFGFATTSCTTIEKPVNLLDEGVGFLLAFVAC
jgi:hypothetical protein